MGIQKQLRRSKQLLRSAAILHFERCEQRLCLSTFVVNTTSDATNPGGGLLTLRQAVADANADIGPDTIAFDPAVFAPGNVQAIKLQNGPMAFTDTTGATTVTGPGSAMLTVDAGDSSRIFQVSAGATVSISGVTITNGVAASLTAVESEMGGGIFNAGELTLSEVAVSNNEASGGNYNTSDGVDGDGGSAEGGGIYSTGDLIITNSMVSGNIATGGRS